MLELVLSAARTPCYILRMSQRDAGLLRTIGTRGLAANIINSVIGAGIFAVPGALAACIGPYAPLAFLVCGVAIGAVAICFAEGGSRMPTSGGPYGYVEAVFGPLAGFIAYIMTRCPESSRQTDTRRNLVGPLYHSKRKAVKNILL